MIVCSLIAWGGNITANRMASAVARDCTRQIRHDLFQKISYLSESRVDAFTIPSLISRMTSDTYVLHQTIGMIQRIGIRAPLLLFGGISVVLQTLDTYSVATDVNMAFINGTLPVMAFAAIIIHLRDIVRLIRTPASEFNTAPKTE